MTEDFDGRMHDLDQEEQTKSDEDEDDDEEQDVDDKMGNLDGADDEKFDEKFWGDSDDEEEDEGGNEEEKGPGAEGKTKSELVAKEENEGLLAEVKSEANKQQNVLESENVLS